MTKRWQGLLLGAAFASLFAAACGGPAEEGKGSGETVGGAHARLRREADASVVISFDEEARSRLALKVETASASTLAPESEAYGRVLDPSPFVALVTERRTAAAALGVAANELARSKRLAADQNASSRTLEAASAAEVQARAAVDDVGARLVMGWGRELPARDDLRDLVADLVSRDAALVRIDLPAHRPLAIRGVHFAFADAPDDEIAAILLGAAPDVDPKVQGQGFLALVRPNPAHLAPGTFLMGFLELAGDATPAVLVPRAAVVRAEGKAWVYVQLPEAGSYHRVEVALERATADGWLATRGAKAGDRLVVEGAQQLLSEEALAAGRAAS